MLVEWIDASRISDGWIDCKNIPKPILHRCVTVGFLVADDDEAKLLLPTIADIEHPDNRHAYGGMLIPGAAIVSMRRLK